ncbi:MAG: FAD-dependent oxidoreductase [Magnetococcales bacterium]|nr:FAD-dependent oxidoreductase [Magnetococcales bacterium]
MNPIIIVGTGLAGYSVAKELRKNGYDGPLTMVTADDGQFYSKPLLSSALAKGQNAESLATSTGDEMANTLNATLLNHSVVESIDTDAHTLTIDGKRHQYNQLVLAIGASPIRLPFKGDGANDVLTVNNLMDYAQFRNQLENTKCVGVIGPGLIGSEFANDMLKSGYKVELIGPDKWPISTLLPEQAGRCLQKSLSDAGAIWHLETFNGSIDKSGSGFRTELQNGSIVEVDLFLSAVGVKPEITLAKASGLQVNRGIVTDEFLNCSAKDVFALGDCAEVAGKNLPYVAPLMIAARALAKTLTGAQTRVIYPYMPVVIKTTLHSIVTLPPAPGSPGAWQVDGNDDGVVGRFFSPDDIMSGFCLTGNKISQKASLLKEMPAL